MTDILLALVAILLVIRLIQADNQHKQLIQLIDLFAEMVGEAIDTKGDRENE